MCRFYLDSIVDWDLFRNEEELLVLVVGSFGVVSGLVLFWLVVWLSRCVSGLKGRNEDFFLSIFGREEFKVY